MNVPVYCGRPGCPATACRARELEEELKKTREERDRLRAREAAIRSVLNTLES